MRRTRKQRSLRKRITRHRGGGVQYLKNAQPLLPEVTDPKTMNNNIEFLYLNAHGTSRTGTVFVVPKNTFIFFFTSSGQPANVQEHLMRILGATTKTGMSWEELLYNLFFSGPSQYSTLNRILQRRKIQPSKLDKYFLYPDLHIYIPGDLVTDLFLSYNTSVSTFSQRGSQLLEPWGIFRLPISKKTAAHFEEFSILGTKFIPPKGVNKETALDLQDKWQQYKPDLIVKRVINYYKSGILTKEEIAPFFTEKEIALLPTITDNEIIKRREKMVNTEFKSTGFHAFHRYKQTSKKSEALANLLDMKIREQTSEDRITDTYALTPVLNDHQEGVLSETMHLLLDNTNRKINKTKKYTFLIVSSCRSVSVEEQMKEKLLHNEDIHLGTAMFPEKTLLRRFSVVTRPSSCALHKEVPLNFTKVFDLFSNLAENDHIWQDYKAFGQTLSGNEKVKFNQNYNNLAYERWIVNILLVGNTININNLALVFAGLTAYEPLESTPPLLLEIHNEFKRIFSPLREKLSRNFGVPVERVGFTLRNLLQNPPEEVQWNAARNRAGATLRAEEWNEARNKALATVKNSNRQFNEENWNQARNRAGATLREEEWNEARNKALATASNSTSILQVEPSS